MPHSGRIREDKLKMLAEDLKHMSIEDVAEKYGYNIESIRAVAGLKAEHKQDHYRAPGKGVGQISKKIATTPHEIMGELRKKPFYLSLKDQLLPEEIDLFHKYWVQLLQQFSGDILPSEELELKELIVLDILIHRALAEQRSYIVRREQLKEELKTKKDKGEKLAIREELTSINGAYNALCKSYQELSDRIRKTRESLHASRQQRAKHLEDAKVNFVQFLRALEDHERRREAGRQLEAIRIAQENAVFQLEQPHKYLDGVVDAPILNSDSVHNLPEEV